MKRWVEFLPDRFLSSVHLTKGGSDKKNFFYRVGVKFCFLTSRVGKGRQRIENTSRERVGKRAGIL